MSGDPRIEKLLMGTSRGFTRLKHLRHLQIYDEGNLPKGIGALQALQTLSRFNICDSPISAVQELGNLKNLRLLSISWEQAEPSDPRYKEYFSSSLEKLSSYGLRSLSIYSEAATSVEFWNVCHTHPTSFNNSGCGTPIFGGALCGLYHSIDSWC